MTRLARRAAWTAAVVAVLALLLPPLINANRFRTRLARSASDALGRKVTMGEVNVRLLPRPGFTITNFVVEDDPAYSAEPMLRADVVNADLRLTSLWRGRMEIATLHLANPSLNLARNAAGQWNVESLLDRASHSGTAPTANRPEVRPRFPYIEADDGRINFKHGAVKLAHALVDADFKLWLESEGQWNMRLNARPVRTDANIYDTGDWRMEGSLQRAASLMDTPVNLQLEVDEAQLGQLSTLVFGRDRGWRGTLSGRAQAKGTPRNLHWSGDLRMRDFRRHDIGVPGSVTADIRCTADMNRNSAFNGAPAFENLDCALPLRDGSLLVKGAIAVAAAPDHDLNIEMSQVPVASVAEFLRRSKKNVASDLEGEGTLRGNLQLRSVRGEAELLGNGTLNGVRFSSQTLKHSFTISDVEFYPRPRLKSAPGASDTRVLQGMLVRDFTVRMGEAGAPLAANGMIDPNGMNIQLTGEEQLSRLLATGKMLGLVERDYRVEGRANITAALAAEWAGFAPAYLTGSAQLRDVTMQMNGVAAPLEISKATLRLSPDQIQVEDIAAGIRGSSTRLLGRVRLQRQCARPPCPAEFDLHASAIDLDEWNGLLNPRFRKTDWLALPARIFGNADENEGNWFQSLNASGTLTVDRTTMKSLEAGRTSARLEIADGVMSFLDLNGEMLGGRHSAEWSFDFRAAPPVFRGKGRVEKAAMVRMATLVTEPIGTGNISGDYELDLRGNDKEALRNSAAGKVTFQWNHGTLRALPTAFRRVPLAFSTWTGEAGIANGSVVLLRGTMQTPSQKYETTGSATFARELDLRFQGPQSAVTVQGPLARPVVEFQPTNPVKAAETASNKTNADKAKN